MALYRRDSGTGSGLALVTKLKFEHMQSLSSFSRMRVDLAAQVCQCLPEHVMHICNWQTKITVPFLCRF